VSRGLSCAACGRRLAVTASGCPCGGLLELDPATGPWEVDPDATGMWRYRSRFPFDPAWDGWRALTMGEGGTAVIPVGPALAKLEYVSPTLSFKDRGAALLVARAQLGGAEGAEQLPVPPGRPGGGTAGRRTGPAAGDA